jgi:hypothetical protein
LGQQTVQHRRVHRRHVTDEAEGRVAGFRGDQTGVLSGDADGDQQLDDLDGNGQPDLEQLWNEIWGGSAPPPSGPPVGFPPVPTGGQ